MRELTQEVKDKIKAKIKADHPELPQKIKEIKQDLYEKLYVEEQYEVGE